MFRIYDTGKNVLRTLEFDKIIDILTQHLASEVKAGVYTKNQTGRNDGGRRNTAEQTDEAESICTRTGKTRSRVSRCAREARRADDTSLFLSTRELLLISASAARLTRRKGRFAGGRRRNAAARVANRLASHRSLEEEINRCILAEDEISDNASPD
ncbi:MAG: hypothetical protein R2912_12500 [Eubacteriales bacterium]